MSDEKFFQQNSLNLVSELEGELITNDDYQEN
jgi:hypothetical protein